MSEKKNEKKADDGFPHLMYRSPGPHIAGKGGATYEERQVRSAEDVASAKAAGFWPSVAEAVKAKK